jgi:pimeloyl-ACP methyl ester carboxylesterase
MQMLYFHGGPGFNSNPEKQLLSAPFADAGIELYLWNEPSILRPEGPPYENNHAFFNYLHQAEQFLFEHYRGQPLTLMAHSFGAQAVLFLCNRHPEKIKQVFFISPDISVTDGDIHRLQLIISYYRSIHDKRADILIETLYYYTGKMDAALQNAYLLMYDSRRLFDYYWFDKKQMEIFQLGYQPSEYNLDATAFFGVRQSWHPIHMRPSTIPAAAIFGMHDVVISRETETHLLQQWWPQLTTYELEDTAHYPHIEATAAVLKLLLQYTAPSRINGK